jgi:pyruvate dehydrogenase E2 component (dihydrolipoamide acetyltransferase)
VKAALASRPALTAAAKIAAAAGALVPEAGSALGGRAGVADLGSGRSPSGPGLPAAPAQQGPAEAVLPTAFPGPITELPIKGIRKIISERMRASLSSTAQLTFNASAPAARLLELRARFKSSDPSLGLSEVTIGDLILYVVSRVLPRFPDANAHLVGDRLRLFERIHLGLAVDTPRGLIVPVIRSADLLSLRQISAEAKRLAAACQSGAIGPDELTGGTFTVSNLGAFGIESFTPVINAPEVGILGVNTIIQRPSVGPGGGIVLEPRLGLSLTVDHQIVDGAPAARILKAFSDAIGDIDLLLMK